MSQLVLTSHLQTSYQKSCSCEEWLIMVYVTESQRSHTLPAVWCSAQIQFFREDVQVTKSRWRNRTNVNLSKTFPSGWRLAKVIAINSISIYHIIKVDMKKERKQMKEKDYTICQPQRRNSLQFKKNPDSPARKCEEYGKVPACTFIYCMVFFTCDCIVILSICDLW